MQVLHVVKSVARAKEGNGNMQAECYEKRQHEEC